MALHVIEKDESESIYDVYAQDAYVESIPKFKMGDNALDPDLVTELILDELLLDGNAKQNLATFCQTDVDKNIHTIMDKCIDKNMIDKDEYPPITLAATCPLSHSISHAPEGR